MTRRSKAQSRMTAAKRVGLSRSVLYAAIAVVSYFLVVRPVSSPEPSFVPSGSNFLIISIDTLRADHLPTYSYKGVETPTISRLAQEGIVFRNAFTPVPLTLPAHASLLTGLLPTNHGIRDNAGFRLGDGVEMIQEVFSKHGYRTGAFVSAFVLDARWGLARGFQQYFDEFDVSVSDLAAMGGIQRRGSETWAAARRWLSAESGAPFFLWVHLFEPHAPYAPPEPYLTRYATSPYDGEVAYVDSLLAEIIDELERLDQLEHTVVVVVSDHGEGLGEHGEDEHGLLAYDSTLRVPWIMRLPGRRFAGTTLDQPVSLIDVVPTVRGLMGIPSPAGIDGLNLTSTIAGNSPGVADMVYGETYYARIHFGWSELVTVRDARFKYIRAPRPALYEYSKDPGESRNVIDQNPGVAARLDEIATRLTAQKPSAPVKPTGIDPETERRLQALGYVGGSSILESRGSQPDPNDKAEIFRTLVRSRHALALGRVNEGIAGLTTLLLEDPPLEQAHRALREHWIESGEHEKALAVFSRLLVRRPGNPQLLQDLALINRAAGRHQRALSIVTRMLAADPRHVGALALAGEILLDLQRPEEAVTHLARAVEAAPGSDELVVKLARAQLHANRLNDAAALLTGSLAEHPGTAGAHYLLAQIAERRGDPTTAEAEYRSEIQGQPWDYQARFNLAMLLGRRGAFREQSELLESIPPIAPAFHEVHFYRAKAYLNIGDPHGWDASIAAAREGLRLAPTSPLAPLGHYVLADIYALQGKHEESARELARGKSLETLLARRSGLSAGERRAAGLVGPHPP